MSRRSVSSIWVLVSQRSTLTWVMRSFLSRSVMWGAEAGEEVGGAAIPGRAAFRAAVLLAGSSGGIARLSRPGGGTMRLLPVLMSRRRCLAPLSHCSGAAGAWRCGQQDGHYDGHPCGAEGVACE